MQPIRWRSPRTLSADVLAQHPNLRPIHIKHSALGRHKPKSDFLVSLQHRTLERPNIAQHMFGTDEVLFAAKQFLQLDGVEIADDLAEVEYFHMLFNQHEVVISNGAETEMLYTGQQALKALDHHARQEIFTLSQSCVVPMAARKLAERHHKNKRDLVISSALWFRGWISFASTPLNSTFRSDMRPRPVNPAIMPVGISC